MQKCVHLVDLVMSFQTNIYLQTLASIQPRTRVSEFANNQPKVRMKVRKNIGAQLDAGCCVYVSSQTQRPPPVQMEGDVVYFDVCFSCYFLECGRARARASQHL